MNVEPEALSASTLAEAAGATEADVKRMADLGILPPLEGQEPFRETDVPKVRLAKACEEAGLPMEGIGAAIRAGRLSFAFLEAAPFARWAARSRRTYREVSNEAGLPLEFLQDALESIGFVRMPPDALIREDELELVPILALGFTTGFLDQTSFTRLGRAWVEGLRVMTGAENELYHARFEVRMLQSGLEHAAAMEGAAHAATEFLPLADRALLAAFRRQQELAWTEHLVEHIETELDAAGILGQPERLPAMCFLDLTGYTALTEERGDEAAARTAGTLAVLVGRTSGQYGGQPVKWLGDGVMFRFRDPGGAVLGALQMVAEIPSAGLPPAHVGMAAGRVIAQGGDYFGRTVNLASRIAGVAGAGQVLVSETVVESAKPAGVSFVDIGGVDLKGFSEPVMVFEARRD